MVETEGKKLQQGPGMVPGSTQHKHTAGLLGKHRGPQDSGRSLRGGPREGDVFCSSPASAFHLAVDETDIRKSVKRPRLIWYWTACKRRGPSPAEHHLLKNDMAAPFAPPCWETQLQPLAVSSPFREVVLSALQPVIPRAGALQLFKKLKIPRRNT